MLLNAASRACLLGGLFALTGCGDFTLVEPQPEGPLLSIFVTAETEESTRYNLIATFRPGIDARGRPTEVVDRALTVEGTPLLPNPQREPGTWSYQWQATRTTADPRADRLLVTFPVVAPGSSAHSVTIPITRRTDPVDVDLVRGNDLVLRLTLPNRVTTGLSGGVDFWTLDVRSNCSADTTPPRIAITGTGPHSSELRLPWDWFETLSADQASVCFRAYSTFQAAGSPYLAYVAAAVSLIWRIHIIG